MDYDQDIEKSVLSGAYTAARLESQYSLIEGHGKSRKISGVLMSKEALQDLMLWAGTRSPSFLQFDFPTYTFKGIRIYPTEVELEDPVFISALLSGLKPSATAPIQDCSINTRPPADSAK